ncbi:MAG: hypothetical protein Ct9H300mP11_16660 [Chloroflexota bacterium]|nr:MAG: hypothetical protein Ct9H300mP11_16660 [Chloroflexota bacterium]
MSTDGKGAHQGYARVSVARKLTVVRAFYRFLVQKGALSFNPVPSGQSFKVKVPKTLPKFLGQREVFRLMDTPIESTIWARDKAFGDSLRLRNSLSEIHSLNLSDINFSRREFL